MVWFTENPMVPITIGLFLVGSLGVFGFILSNRPMIWMAVVSLIATIGVVVIERSIVTEKEKLHQMVHDMARCVRKNDFDGLMEFATKRKEAGRENRIRRQLSADIPKCDFRMCRITGFAGPTFDEQDPERKATLDFVAWVDVDATATRYGYDGSARRRVILNMEKEEDGVWRITGFSHSDPMASLYGR